MSQIKSTAAFDENPQSRERGITIDLGFSAFQLTDRIKFSIYLLY
jgi:selenocysteine-specific elongation factor